MRLNTHTATTLRRWVKSAEAQTLHAGRLNIGPRLILGFVIIILSMLAANAVVLWQFHLVRTQAERLNGIDQKLVAVLRVHTSLLAFHDRLEELADAQDVARVVREGGSLRTMVLDDTGRAISVLSQSPFNVARDPTILPTLRVIQSALPSQLDAITTLAMSGDWRAVHLRLANQITPLKSLTSALVETVDREVGEEQAQTVRNIKRVQRLVFVVVPLTAVFTLLIAATLGLAITRGITQPLARLVEGSKALARGEFQHQVAVTGRDELAHLGQVFNDTARRLRELYAYLAEAQRLSKTGSFGWRPSTSEIFWSAETFHIFQYERTMTPTLELVLQRVHPGDAAALQQTIERASRNGTDFEHECRLLMPDGAVKHVHVLAHAERDKSAGLEFVGAVMDITDRKRAEAELRRSEGYLAQGQRLTQSGSWAWNIRTGARFWSQETYRIFGCGPETVKPTWEDILERSHPEDRAAIIEKAQRETTVKEDSEFDWRIVLPDGRIKYLHSIAHPVLDESGEITEVVGTLMDVTERNRAEALREGESRILEMIARDAHLEGILDQLVRVVESQFAGLLCSVLLLDEDGQHVRHGAAPSLPEAYLKAIDGLSIGPQAGSCGTAMYRRELVVVTDILEDPLWEPYRKAVEAYGLRACWSIPILAHSGKALGSFAMYYREPRSPSAAETRALQMATHLAGIAIERRQAREERERLRQAQVELAHINRVTTMGELTASLAHEVNQPIAASVTSANSCIRWLEAEVPNLDKARAAAGRIVKDGTRAAEIISRIRLLFQRGGLAKELVDVNEVIDETVVLLCGEATRYSISVRTELAADLPPVMGDRVQLQQLLMNLMTNSIDAMKGADGTRELNIKSQRAENEHLLVSVSDTGVGLPPGQADQIFNAFFTTKPHGTGMGLRICRSIVESHGGRLWAAENFPRGASFYLTLPAKFKANTEKFEARA